VGRQAARLLGLTLVALAGCGTGQTRVNEVFHEDSTPRSGAPMGRIEARLRQVALPLGSAVAIGALDDALLGLPLGGGEVWRFTHPQSSRPVIAGRVVLSSGGGELVGLDALTGKRLWARPTGGLELIGAGDDGEITVATLTSVSRRSYTLLAVNRDGVVLRQLETEERLGRPAVIRGLAFVPWGERFLTAYDLLLGEEVARLTLREGLSSAFLEDRTLFFGDARLVRFDELLAQLPADELPRAALPEIAPFNPLRMTPRLDDQSRLIAGVPDRVRAFARPVARGLPMGVEPHFYTAFFRLVQAHQAGHEGPIWVHAGDSDVIGGVAFAGGLAICDSGGRVRLLDEASGAVLVERSLGRALRSCVVQADGFERAAAGAAPDVAAQIKETLFLQGPELLPMQADLLGRLGRLEAPGATDALLELCIDPRTPAALLAPIRAAIAQRRSDPDSLLRALDRAPDPARDALRPPPLGPIAEALHGMNERRGAALLARRLLWPQTPPEALRKIAGALVDLGSLAEVAALEAFFSAHLTDEDADTHEALVAAARALLKLGGLPARSLVIQAATDPATPAALRPRLSALLAG
jgi:outer membrane protein assembly factor BamB